MRWFLLAVFFCLSFFAAQSVRAEFVGKLLLKPSGCQQTGRCKLGEDFYYIQRFRGKQPVTWRTEKGDFTDGASIPWWAQGFIGKPFDKYFVKAAVIYDHYCDRHVRTRSATNRVFYDALLESGVSKDKSGIMYLAVILGAPPWIELRKDVHICHIGPDCVSLTAAVNVPRTEKVVSLRNGNHLVYGRATYNTSKFKKLFKRGKKHLAQKRHLTPEAVEAEGNRLRASVGDFYLKLEQQKGSSVAAN